MRDKKLITILKTFSGEEWSDFNKSIKLTTNKETDVYNLYRYIYKHKSDLDSKHLIFEIVKKTVFPQKSKKGFQNVISKLINIAEQFIKSEWLKEKKVEDDILMFEAFAARGLTHLAKLKYNHLIQYFKSDENLGLIKNINQFRVHHLNRSYFESNTHKNANETLQESITSLMALTINAAGLYQYASGIHGQKNDTLYDALEQIKPTEYSDSLTQYVSSINSLSTNYKAEDYDILYKELIKEETSFSLELQALVLKLLLIRNGRLIKNGQTHLRERHLKLHTFGIESGIYLSNNKLEYITFINIISLASAIEKFEWANVLIEKYSNLIDIKHRSDTINISKIQILFHQKKYTQLNEILSTVQINTESMNLVFRWVLLCCHFKLFRNDLEFLDNTFRNFKSFLNTNKPKISSKNHTGSLNLCNILANLSKNYSKEYLRGELDSSKIIVYRAWLEKLYKEMEPTAK